MIQYTKKKFKKQKKITDNIIIATFDCDFFIWS